MAEEAVVCYKYKKPIEVSETIHEKMQTFSRLLLCEKCDREIDPEGVG